MAVDQNKLLFGLSFRGRIRLCARRPRRESSVCFGNDSPRSPPRWRCLQADDGRNRHGRDGACGGRGELRHVVRTVVYVLDMADVHQIARAHEETFGASRPASTLVQVAALTPASARAEIEVTAVIHD